MTDQGHVKLFRSGCNQAVIIAVEFELPGDQAVMRREGDLLVIEPIRKRGLIALLETMKSLDEGFPEIDDPPLASDPTMPAQHSLSRVSPKQLECIKLLCPKLPSRAAPA